MDESLKAQVGGKRRPSTVVVLLGLRALSCPVPCICKSSVVALNTYMFAFFAYLALTVFLCMQHEPDWQFEPESDMAIDTVLRHLFANIDP